MKTNLNPKSIDKAKNQLFLNKNVIVIDNDEQFCFMKNNKSVPIFICSINSIMLCQARETFVDGTFSYCPTFLTVFIQITQYETIIICL